MAKTNKDLKKLPSGGRTGKWKFSVSKGGFMSAANYLEVLADIDEYLTENGINRPVIFVLCTSVLLYISLFVIVFISSILKTTL